MKKLTINDFPVYNYVRWKDCEDIMGKRKYKQFLKWMYGQTHSEHGPYPWDVDRFLKGLPITD